MSFETEEEKIIKMNDEELNNYLFNKEIILREVVCLGSCKRFLKYEYCENYVDSYCWRCYSIGCTEYNKRISIRNGSVFENIGKDMRKIFKIILRWCSGQQQHSILSSIDISKPTFRKIMNILNKKMKIENRNTRKLGGPGTIIQIDETMLNYKCKSHRGRSSTNRSDALCIVECAPNITKVWAEIIPNKRASTIIPIICDRVISGSTIITDEHRSYNSLISHGFIHKSVCHKYNFVDPITQIHTQHVESFNNALKYSIKKMKGILTTKRADFLTEFVWKWNNRECLFDAIIKLLKV